MAANIERRSSEGGTEGREQAPGPSQRVGARHRGAPSPMQGGGYLNVCTQIEFDFRRTDQRVAELRAIGLRRFWLEFASEHGVEVFLALWRRLDEEKGLEITRHDLPRWSAYTRYQRNQAILALSAGGATPEQILDHLRRELGQTISRGHVVRVIRRGLDR